MAEEEADTEVEEEEEEEEEEEGEKDEEVEEEEEDDGDFDFEALAERAVRVAEVRRRRGEEKELSLDVGLTADQLYLVPGSGSRAFNTSAVPGVSRLDAADFARGAAIEAPAPDASSREVRGAPVRPVNDKSLRIKEGKKLRESRLEKWFGLRKREITPELEKELKAIKLRANFDPKRFYKAHDSKALPKFFTIATEVGGGLAPAGMAASREVTAHSGRSFLSEVLRNEKAQEWTRKRQLEVEQRGQASFRSGHGSARPKKAQARSKHRGGNWKKQKNG